MPENTKSYFSEMKAGANAKLAEDLSSTFDSIAKAAMRASAEFSDLKNDPGVFAKIQKHILS